MTKRKDDANALLKVRDRPMTEMLGFLECSAKKAAEAFHAWRDRTYTRDGRELCIRPVQTADLESALDVLLPLVTRTNRWLFLETNSRWCIYFGNTWRGTDPTPLGPMAGIRCKCRGIRADSTPNIPLRQVGETCHGSYGAVILEVFRPTWTEYGNTERAIYAMNDGGRWIFETSGEPYDFENVDRYTATRKRDRFTHEMLNEYLQHFGIDAYRESFYCPHGTCRGFLVSVEGDPFPDQREYSLDEVRRTLQ